jgi:hypothetical protein
LSVCAIRRLDSTGLSWRGLSYVHIFHSISLWNKLQGIKMMSNLNHLFQRCKTGSFAKCGQIDRLAKPLIIEKLTPEVASFKSPQAPP